MREALVSPELRGGPNCGYLFLQISSDDFVRALHLFWMSGGTDKSLAAQLGKIQSGMGSVFVSRVSSDAQRTDEHVKV